MHIKIIIGSKKMKLMKHHSPSKASSTDQQQQQKQQPTSRNQTNTNKNNATAAATMKDVEKKIKKEMKKSIKSSLPPDTHSSSAAEKIEPPRLHRDMRLICDVFRISDQTRHALRSFDASNLEDFSLMTIEDYADMIVTQARIGKPLPPLQQRKVRVLLSWVQSLPSSGNTNINMDKKSISVQQLTHEPADMEVQESKSDNTNSINPKTDKRSVGSCNIPSNWENQFYSDLPRLKQELCDMGKNNKSNWASEFLSLRWIFCGS